MDTTLEDFRAALAALHELARARDAQLRARGPRERIVQANEAVAFQRALLAEIRALVARSS